MGVPEVSAAATALTDARGLLVKLQQSTLAEEHRSLVHRVMEVVSDAILRLFAVDSALFGLQEENTILQSKLDAAEDLERRIGQYEIHQTAAGATVYRYRYLPQYYACPRCTESSQQIHILQPMEDHRRGDYRCPGCSESYPFEQRDCVPLTATPTVQLGETVPE